LFLQKFKQKNRGFILNVASIAGFMAGPQFSSYYASKSYVIQLTRAIHEELRYIKSNVYVGAFCPGPVRTEFNEIAGAEFATSGISDVEAAEYAIEKMLDGQMIIIPTFGTKILRAAAKLAPDDIVLAATGAVQRSRKVIEKDTDIIRF
ncbi:MAG: SDR family NAD(P)-dependent oxidoreductase, partial [Ruminiclostridium sp.]|nr:SDR family NAD(P)-dependent oxidoreductase [Ruminiclostridium sp.]